MRTALDIGPRLSRPGRRRPGILSMSSGRLGNAVGVELALLCGSVARRSSSWGDEPATDRPRPDV